MVDALFIHLINLRFTAHFEQVVVVFIWLNFLESGVLKFLFHVSLRPRVIFTVEGAGKIGLKLLFRHHSQVSCDLMPVELMILELLGRFHQ